MKSNFNVCLNRLLKDEGGYTNDPADAGGPTNFGITLKDYRLYINKDGTAEDVKNMAAAQAKAIYKTKYWDALGCDNLSSGVDYTCFDYGVNSGVGRPRKALEQFKSLSGIKLIDAINNERMAFLEALIARKPSQERFRRGWTNRVNGVRNYSHILAKDNTTGPASGAVAGMSFFGMLSQYAHNHPYIVVSGSLAVGILIWAGVHYLRNKNVSA